MQGRVRAITSDKDFERELQQAGESLVVVDFKTDWWVEISIKICVLKVIIFRNRKIMEILCYVDLQTEVK